MRHLVPDQAWGQVPVPYAAVPDGRCGGWVEVGGQPSAVTPTHLCSVRPPGPGPRGLCLGRAHGL